MISIEKEERPWGRFFVIHNEQNYKLKRIEVDPKGRLSYQYHNKRSEVWTIIEGIGRITINGQVKDYRSGETIIIPQGSKHRIENLENKSVKIIEAQIGSLLKETDIIRYKDIYGRIK